MVTRTVSRKKNMALKSTKVNASKSATRMTKEGVEYEITRLVESA